MKGEPTEPARDAGEGHAMNDKGRRPDPSEGLRTGTGAQYAGLVAEVLRERRKKQPGQEKPQTGRVWQGGWPGKKMQMGAGRPERVALL